MKRIIVSFLLCFPLLLQAEKLYINDKGEFFATEDNPIVNSEESKQEIDPIVLLSKDVKDDESKLIRFNLRSIKKRKPLPLEQNATTSKNKEALLTLKGNLRTGYIYLKEDNSLSKQSKATGGNIGFRTKNIFPGIVADVSFYAIEALGTSNTNDDFNIKAGDSTPSYGFIGKSKITGTFGNHKFRLGRQELSMPHSDSDHIRMVPNLFEAYRYAYKDFIHIGQIKSMAGWENAGDNSQFINIHEVLKITNEHNRTINKGATVIHFEDTLFNNSFEYTVFDYIIHDALNIVYLQANYKHKLSENMTLKFSGQYNSNRSTDPFIMENISYNAFDSDLVGYLASLKMETITLMLAMNKVSGSNAPLRSLGGGPYFTSMEDSTIDAIGDNDARSKMFSLHYDAHKLAPGLYLDYFYGTFASGDKTVNHVEQNFALEYKKKDLFKLTMAYTLVNNQSSAITAGASDFNLFRAFLDIPLTPN